MSHFIPRSTRRALRFLAPAAAVAAVPSFASAQPQHARLAVVPETTTVAPGGTVNLGLVVTMDEHWHVYWPGYNDTGFPVTWEMEGPGEAAPAIWPAPVRYESPGRILDHIFEERVTIIVPVTAPSDAEAGDTLRWTFDAQWLVCREACIPGGAKVSVEVVVASPGEIPTKNPEATEPFVEARARTPIGLGDAKREIGVSAKADSVSFRAPKAKALAFYPREDSRAPVNLLGEGETNGSNLTIKFEGGQPVVGVLEVFETDGTSTLVNINTGAETEIGSPG